MTNKNVVEMIDEYLKEPHNINKDWVKALLICKKVIIDSDHQNAEIEKLNVELVGMRGACESYKIHYDNAQAEIERLRKSILFTMDTEHVNEVKQDILNTVEYNIELIKSDAIEEYKEKVKAILVDKGIYPIVVKNALNEAEKEMTGRKKDENANR